MLAWTTMHILQDGRGATSNHPSHLASIQRESGSCVHPNAGSHLRMTEAETYMLWAGIVLVELQCGFAFEEYALGKQPLFHKLIVH